MDTAPTVYFIDDTPPCASVIKIAFRRENINVMAVTMPHLPSRRSNCRRLTL